MNGDKARTRRIADPLRPAFRPGLPREVGSDKRREIRAVGDIVNTASRVQTANKLFGTWILASGRRAARASFRHCALCRSIRAEREAAVAGALPAFIQSCGAGVRPEFEHGLAAFVSGRLRYRGLLFSSARLHRGPRMESAPITSASVASWCAPAPVPSGMGAWC